jgi:hypothetical protein
MNDLTVRAKREELVLGICIQYFNHENIIRGCKSNEAVSNRKCNASNTQRDTCATSYVTADNSRPMAYLILKIICK